MNKLANEAVPAAKLDSQGVPQELGNFASEVIFVLVCSAGQLLFAWFLGDINVIQVQLKEVLGIENTQLPWLMGAFSIANGLSVMLAGSITDRKSKLIRLTLYNPLADYLLQSFHLSF